MKIQDMSENNVFFYQSLNDSFESIEMEDNT
jgi:hypothetical protein